MEASRMSVIVFDPLRQLFLSGCLLCLEENMCGLEWSPDREDALLFGSYERAYHLLQYLKLACDYKFVHSIHFVKD